MILLLSLYPLGCASAHPRAHLGAQLSRSTVNNFSDIIHHFARQYRIDPALIFAVISVESSFNPEARSPAGARGLMQLMPSTAKWLSSKLGWRGARIDDPRFNIAAGTYYLSYLLRMFDDDERLSLAAYNAGPGFVRRIRRQRSPLPSHCLKYVSDVLEIRARYREVDRAKMSARDRELLFELVRNGRP